MFELMSSGDHTLDTLRDELFQRGFYFASYRPHWTRSYLATLLRNPFYIGKIRWRGQTYEGKHKPLIDQQTWIRVQEILDGHTRCKRHTKRRFTYGHGLLKCAQCGYNITAEFHKQRYTYYRCP